VDPVVRFARHEHEVDLVCWQRCGVRAPVDDVDLAVGRSVGELVDVTRAGLLRSVGGTRIRNVWRRGVERTLGRTRVWRQDPGPPAATGLYFQDGHSGLQSPELERVNRMPIDVARLLVGRPP